MCTCSSYLLRVRTCVPVWEVSADRLAGRGGGGGACLLLLAAARQLASAADKIQLTRLGGPANPSGRSAARRPRRSRSDRRPVVSCDEHEERQV
jgi:hypothetical protein|eukprot:COSAG01_NODE_4954_length_4592_cov_10.344981_2_plen_94_part_00